MPVVLAVLATSYFGIAALVNINRGKKWGKMLAMLWLLFGFILNALVVAYSPIKIANGGMSVALSGISCVLWILYFEHSKRVKNTLVR